MVDDHLGTATTLARAIAQLGPGVEVIPATSGQEALEQVKHAAADILITDMIMPEMTGLELIEKLQNNPSGRPSFSFLITAYDVPGLKVTARRMNVTEVFTKPVNPERICQTVIQAMEKINQAKPAPKETCCHKKNLRSSLQMTSRITYYYWRVIWRMKAIQLHRSQRRPGNA